MPMHEVAPSAVSIADIPPRFVMSDRGQVLGQAKRQSRAPVWILNAGIAEMRAIVSFLLCELLVELEEFGNALAFGHGLDGEAVGGHHGAVVVLVGTA